MLHYVQHDTDTWSSFPYAYSCPPTISGTKSIRPWSPSSNLSKTLMNYHSHNKMRQPSFYMAQSAKKESRDPASPVRKEKTDG